MAEPTLEKMRDIITELQTLALHAYTFPEHNRVRTEVMSQLEAYQKLMPRLTHQEQIATMKQIRKLIETHHQPIWQKGGSWLLDPFVK